MRFTIFINDRPIVYFCEDRTISYEFLAIMAGFKSTDSLRIFYVDCEVSDFILPNGNGPVSQSMKFFVREEE